jgi:hypothetical protein
MLAAITEQMKPNRGTSIYDKVTRIADRTQQPPEIHIHTEGKAEG